MGYSRADTLTTLMKPKFKNPEAWQQAELLMQPALIRLVDNIRSQVEPANWTATYQEVQTPIPGYLLCLERNGEQHQFDLWEMCYKICFRDYAPTHAPGETAEVDIDTSLIEAETGDVDWQQLEVKAKRVVTEVLAGLKSGQNVS